MSSRRNICSASSRIASGWSEDRPNASARSRWTWAVAAPSRSASPAKSPPTSLAGAPWVASGSRPLAGASARPSEAARRYLDKMASTVVAPSILVSTQPYGSAMCVEPSWASARDTSRSGFGPGVARRNTFKMADSPNTRLVLLCSPVSTRLSIPPSSPEPPEPQRISAPGTRQNRSVPTVRSATIEDNWSGKRRIQGRAVRISRIPVAGPIRAHLRGEREAAQQRRNTIQLPAAEWQGIVARDARLTGDVQRGRAPVSRQIVAVHDHLCLILSLRAGQPGIHVQVLGPGVIGAKFKTFRQAPLHIDLQRVVA